MGYDALVAWCVPMVVLLMVMGATDVRADPGGIKHPCAAGCRDGNPCTFDFCARTGCVHQPVSGSPCDDGDACTEDDRCQAGQCRGRPRSCDDGLACTADSCGPDGQCRHRPDDASCDGAECAAAACRPGDSGADARGCVKEPSADDTPCADDGAACTVDLCAAGECRHIPRDERCVGESECQTMTCAPSSDGADQRGCIRASAAPAGTECTEDEEPCSDDVCRNGRCAHEQVADASGCAPVREPFRTARTLLVQARSLGSELASLAGTRAVQGSPGVSPLREVEDELEAAARVLGGKSDEGARSAGSLHEATSQRRARVAASILRPTPRRLARTLRRAGRSVPAASRPTTRQEGRELLRGTRGLLSTLRRMTRVTGTFVR